MLGDELARLSKLESVPLAPGNSSSGYQITNAQTPSKLGNRTLRVKVISDGWDSRLGARRQSTYVERVR